MVDVEVEDHAEECLVGGRQQQRVPQTGERGRGPQQFERLCGRLAEVETGVEDDLVGRRCPAAPARRGAVEEEPPDGVEDVVVDGARDRGPAGARRMWVATTAAPAADAAGR